MIIAPTTFAEHGVMVVNWDHLAPCPCRNWRQWASYTSDPRPRNGHCWLKYPEDYSTVQYCTAVLYSIYCTVLYTVQYCTVLYCGTVQYSTVQY